MKKNYTIKDVIFDPSDKRLKDTLGKQVYLVKDIKVPFILIEEINYGNIFFSTLREVNKDSYFPFVDSTNSASYFIVLYDKSKEKPEPEYEPYDFSDSEVREKLIGKIVKSKKENDLNMLTHFSFDIVSNCWHTIYGTTSQELFDGYTFLDGTPCGELVEK